MLTILSFVNSVDAITLQYKWKDSKANKTVNQLKRTWESHTKQQRQRYKIDTRANGRKNTRAIIKRMATRSLLEEQVNLRYVCAAAGFNVMTASFPS
jgi:hypothetical protein